jgi:hypothetical protein
LAELNWSLCGMAVAELLALREQLAQRERQPAHQTDPRDRSLANTMRALRKAMRNLRTPCDPWDNLLQNLSRAKVQRYRNRTDKRARYRPASCGRSTQEKEKNSKPTTNTSPPKMLHSVARWGWCGPLDRLPRCAEYHDVSATPLV